MAFWSDGQSDGPGNPKRQYRFKVQMGKKGEVASFLVKKTDKPSFAVSEAEHKFLNHTYYYPGRVTWNTITITLVDMGGMNANDDTSYSLSKMIFDAGYDPGNAQSYATMSKKSAVGRLGQVVIQQLQAVGDSKVAEEQWTLKNAWIQDLKFGDLAYDGDDLTEITVVLRYDWAELKVMDGTVLWSESAAAGGALVGD